MTTTTRVVNRHKSSYDVYVGRGTPFGNPFHVGDDGDLATVLVKFERHVRADEKLVEKIRRELRGRVLGCSCKPKPCHGDILAKIADEGVKTKAVKPAAPSAPAPKKQTIPESKRAAMAAGARCDICPLYDSRPVYSEGPNGTTVSFDNAGVLQVYVDDPESTKKKVDARDKVKLIVIGEGPGRKEELVGRPFQGMSGQLINTLFRQVGIDRRQAFVGNAALCRGERDRDNERAGVCCAPRLLRELDRLPVDAPIIALGKAAALTVLGTKSIMHARGFVWKSHEIDPGRVADVRKAVVKAEKKIAEAKKDAPTQERLDELKLRAAVIEGRARISGRAVFPTIHPAFVLRADTWQPILRIDLDRAARWLRGELDWDRLLDSPKQKYTVLSEPVKIRGFLAKMKKVVAVDIETDDIDVLTTKILCTGISDGKKTLVIWPWRRVHAKILSKFFRTCTAIGMHNGYNFDQIVMRRTDNGIVIPDDKIEDTLIAHHTFASHFPQRLAHVASVFLDAGPWKISFKKGAGAEEKGLAPAQLPADQLCMYNSVDARIQAQVWLAMQADLESERAVYAHDKQVAACICREMMINGIWRDPRRTEELSVIIEEKKTRLANEMRTLINRKGFQPSKHADVRKALFTTLNAPMLFPTDSGLPSTSSATLEELKKQPTRAGKFSKLVLEWRGADKVKGTYIDAIKVAADTRFHPNWKSYGTVSGRLSSRLQSVPRKEVRKEDKSTVEETRVREVYAAPEGRQLLYFDLKQSEMRAAAYLSSDDAFIANCETGDIHTANARILFPDEAAKGWLDGDQLKTIGKLFRDITKNAGFGILYQAQVETIFSFLKSKGFPVELMQVIACFEEIHRVYWRYYQYCDENYKRVQKDGYMRTKLIGRIRWLGWHPTIQDVSNFDVQSFVADVMNIRLIELRGLLPPSFKLVAQIHDAAIFEAPASEIDDGRKILQECWARPIMLPHNGRSVVLPIDDKVGSRWSEF